jgi:hypothetical protein
MKKNEQPKQATPVMKKLARPMSKEELATVSGAGTWPSTTEWIGDTDRAN